MPLSSSSLKRSDFNNLIDEVKKRLNDWSGRLLTLSGRLEPIKTVIHSTIFFWMQLCQMPKNVIDHIEKICANFFWQGRKHLVGWNKICMPKEEGGMGLRNLHDIAKALLIKFL